MWLRTAAFQSSSLLHHRLGGKAALKLSAGRRGRQHSQHRRTPGVSARVGSVTQTVAYSLKCHLGNETPVGHCSSALQ
jgi:hypothetical protein